MRNRAKQTPHCILLIVFLIFMTTAITACDTGQDPNNASCSGAPKSGTAADVNTFFVQCCPNAVEPTPISTTAPITAPLSAPTSITASTTTPTVATSTPQPAATPPVPIDLHLPHMTVAMWLDITGSFPGKYLREALNKLADSIDALIEPGMGGMTVYISVIEHDSYSPDANLLVKKVDAIAPDSPLPALQPEPKTTGNPVQDAQNQQDTQNANCQTLSAYYPSVAKHQAEIPSIQKLVKEQVTDPIRNLALPPTDNIATDLPGALERSSDWFKDETGQKWWIGVTDLFSNTDEQRAGTVDFKGVETRVDFHFCGNDTDESAGVCMANDSWWVTFFQNAGSQSVKLLDPAQSEALGSLFS